MKLILLQVGKTDKDYVDAGVDDFSRRVKRLAQFETITIPDIKNRKSLSSDEQKKREADKIKGQFRSGDHTILLDEKGKLLGSVDFSKTLDRLMSGSNKRVLFIIGGPYGFHKDLYNICNSSLSLSSLTFSHQLVRLLFMEQLYRGLSIIKGLPYHNE